MKFWIRSTAREGVLWRLAKEQLTKDKKKAGIVILYLSAGLSLLLCLVTLLESEAARTIVSNYMDMDMVLENKTLKKENREDRRQVMDEEFFTLPNFPTEQKPSGGCAATRAEQKLCC